MKEIVKYSALVIVIAAAAACDKVPLLAPSGSQITLTANASTVPTNGTVGLTAFVTESGGTPVQNGTAVRFTSTLGTVSPVEAQTTNGLAVATFQAGDASGVAEIHAISGGANGSSGSGTTATATNVVKISVGAAGANKITVSANPASVSPNGGSATITATVLDTNGGGLAGVPVTFSSDQGVVAPSIATTDASGQARTTLTSSVDTVVTATAGTQSATVTLKARSGPGLTITCAVASGTGTTCASVQANSSTNTATLSFTVSKGTGSSNLQSATINFGDGTTQALGNLSGGSVTVSHSYTPGSYTPTVTATDVNGESASTSTSVTVTPRGQLAVDLAVSPGDSSSHPVTETFTATVTNGDGVKYDWDFGDGTTVSTTTNKTTHVYSQPNNYTASVTVTTSDNRTGVGRVEFNVK